MYHLWFFTLKIRSRVLICPTILSPRIRASWRPRGKGRVGDPSIIKPCPTAQKTHTRLGMSYGVPEKPAFRGKEEQRTIVSGDVLYIKKTSPQTCAVCDDVVPVTLKNGLNSGFSRADSKIDSISSFFLCDCEVVCFHILIRYGEVFITVFLKYGAICIECNADVGVSENFLQNLCGHTRFDAPCRISVSE